MDFMTRDKILERLQRELEVVASLQDICRKNADRSTRLGLREVCAFESGVETGYEYLRGVLVSMMVDFEDSTSSVDGE